LDVN